MAMMEETVMKMIVPRRHKAAPGAAAAGMETEFGDIYRRFLRPVYAFVAYRVGDRVAAEDITAQVFEKAWRGFSGFDPKRAGASTWIFTIARNCLTDHWRGAARNPGEVELQADLKSDAAADPEPRLQALELRRELSVALDSLETREREIVALKFGGGMNNREIAGLLEITETNVGTILYRSLRKLKNQLEGGIKND
jgi:RNA polymerase sigma-70 factor (ECF subfamily)